MKEKIERLRVKLFFDGASITHLHELHDKSYIQGFTTNPTLIRKEGVIDYQRFAQQMIDLVPTKPISFGVCTDNLNEMAHQALQIASWGSNVYVKIPIMNTQGEACYELVKKLVAQKIKLNITAVMTEEQVRQVIRVLSPEVPAYISLFAGRIADTGRDPSLIMKKVLHLVKDHPQIELIWASPRELLNIFQAEEVGCHIITLSKDIINKLPLIGYNLEEYSRETVKMFYKDAVAAELRL